MRRVHKLTSRHCLSRRLIAVGAGVALAVGSTVPAHAASVVYGMDVSSHQGNVDWGTAWANGARFAYVKATEGTYYTNDYFAQQYNGSYNVGMIRGSYHFAIPDNSGGATQADYFIAHGGGWSPDGKTLPGALDIEYNPYGATCYGLSQSSMVSWIADFSNEYHSREGVYPVIYTTTDWWTTCTGNSAAFAPTNPLWIARYASGAGTLPAGWSYYTFWQYADSGTFPGDQDQFNGAYDRLQALANG
jgi:GH25 family lysozyme M1 (1,4-beta-N-acetylmuramidase)